MVQQLREIMSAGDAPLKSGRRSRTHLGGANPRICNTGVRSTKPVRKGAKS
jgi:hypothetical protein